MRKIAVLGFLLLSIVPVVLTQITRGDVQLVDYCLYKTGPQWSPTKPANSTTKFTQQDPAVHLWFRVKITVSITYVVSWLRPDGTIHSAEKRQLSIAQNNDWQVMLKLDIRGQRAARYLGEWAVKVVADEGKGEFELFRRNFTIDAAGMECDFTWTINERREVHIEVLLVYHLRDRTESEVGFTAGYRVANFTAYDYETKEKLVSQDT